MTDLFQLPEFIDSRGKLTFVEEINHLPFEIKHVYLLDCNEIPDKISIVKKAFAMVPVGKVTVNSKVSLSGISTGVLITSDSELLLKAASGSKLLILSESLIDGLTPLYIPFKIRRVYFMAEIAPGKSRGNHAHLETSQIIYSLKGQFEVELDDSIKRENISLTPDSQPVEAPVRIWHTLSGFSPDAVCMVLASELFNPDDYISDYSCFLNLHKSSGHND